MAIVASHAALETIVPYILETRASWTNELLGGRNSFNSKFRAAAAFIGLIGDPLAHAPKIMQRAKSFSNADAFEMSSIFRNRIVHQGREFSYDGLELIEIWEFQQWMVEIFIFYLLGHRGTMNDRRRYTGWRGPGVEIPLPRHGCSTHC